MKNLAYLIFCFTFTLQAASINYVSGRGSDTPKLLGEIPSEDYFPSLEEKTQSIWTTVQKLAQQNEAEAPLIHFYPFKQTQVPNSWKQFQSSWAEVQESQGFKEKPFNARFLPGYQYKDTPYIQIRPSFFTEPLQRGMVRFHNPNAPIDRSGKGYYTLGHEMLHYLMNQKNVPMAWHHCLFITHGLDNISLMDRLFQALISKSLVRKEAKQMITLERMNRPCLSLGEQDKQSIQTLANDLSIL